MADSWNSRFDDIKARLKEIVRDSEGDVDLDSVVARLRATVEKTGNDVDADAIVARAKEAFGAVEGKVDADKLRAWAAEVDRETIQGWVGEAKTAAASAASFVGAQGERLADRAPGAFDKVVGAAKEAAGGFIGNEELAREGEMQLKGDIEERFAGADEVVEGGSKGSAETGNEKREGSAG